MSGSLRTFRILNWRWGRVPKSETGICWRGSFQYRQGDNRQSPPGTAGIIARTRIQMGKNDREQMDRYRSFKGEGHNSSGPDKDSDAEAWREGKYTSTGKWKERSQGQGQGQVVKGRDRLQSTDSRHTGRKTCRTIDPTIHKSSYFLPFSSSIAGGGRGIEIGTIWYSRVGYTGACRASRPSISFFQ